MQKRKWSIVPTLLSFTVKIMYGKINQVKGTSDKTRWGLK